MLCLQLFLLLAVSNQLLALPFALETEAPKSESTQLNDLLSLIQKREEAPAPTPELTKPPGNPG